jgi:hypothetical protein
MFDQAPEHGGLEFRSGFVVNRHGRTLAVLRKLTDINWALSQNLPYRSANVLNQAGFRGRLPENKASPLTVLAGYAKSSSELR